MKLWITLVCACLLCVIYIYIQPNVPIKRIEALIPIHITYHNISEQQIHDAIIAQGASTKEQEERLRDMRIVTIEHHQTLLVEQQNNLTYVYANVQSENYDEKLTAVSGYHAPIRIIFAETEDGVKVQEFWIPNKGNDYAPSIEKIYPADLVEKTYNTGFYDLNFRKLNKRSASNYFKQSN